MALIFGAGVSAFGCEARYWICEPNDQVQLEQLPQLLSDTGLFGGTFDEQLGEGVRAYRPEFTLWSDGAEKRRWIWLPQNTRIDTSDGDNWSFPVGTKFWKEFTRDGTRVETRLLTRFGSGESDWIGAAYVWSPEQRDGTLAAAGVSDALGTAHDVPASNECMACHGGTKSRVLGFSPIQLAHAAEPGEVALEALDEAGLLGDAIEVWPSVPGDATERAALGYLHANCGHCHNQDRPAHDGARCFDPQNELDFRLSVHALGSVADTATRQTIGKAAKPGRPGDSRLIDLMSHRGLFKQMPPLATERVDRQAVELLSTFVRELD